MRMLGTRDAPSVSGDTTFADPEDIGISVVGHGDGKLRRDIVALNDIGYTGPLSVEWEDSRMDREHGATEAAAMCENWISRPSKIAFDAQFDR